MLERENCRPQPDNSSTMPQIPRHSQESSLEDMVLSLNHRLSVVESALNAKVEEFLNRLIEMNACSFLRPRPAINNSRKLLNNSRHKSNRIWRRESKGWRNSIRKVWRLLKDSNKSSKPRRRRAKRVSIVLVPIAKTSSTWNPKSCT